MSALAPGFEPLIAEATRRARQRRLLVVAALALLAAGAIAFGVEHWKLAMVSRQAPTALPELLGNTGSHYATGWHVRPAAIVYSGDGSSVLGGYDGNLGQTGGHSAGHLNWATWTHEKAIGHGVIWQNDCNPYCARGRFVAEPATVEAFRPVHGRFTRLRLIYALPRGGHYTETLGLSRAHGFWGYGPVR